MGMQLHKEKTLMGTKCGSVPVLPAWQTALSSHYVRRQEQKGSWQATLLRPVLPPGSFLGSELVKEPPLRQDLVLVRHQQQAIASNSAEPYYWCCQGPSLAGILRAKGPLSTRVSQHSQLFPFETRTRYSSRTAFSWHPPPSHFESIFSSFLLL